MTAGAAAEYHNRLTGRYEFALFEQSPQHHAITRRADRGVAEIETRCIACGARDRGLSAQVLQGLEADDLIGVQALAAIEIALGLLCRLPRLFDLRIDFGEFEFGQHLTPTHATAFLHGYAADDTTRLE